MSRHLSHLSSDGIVARIGHVAQSIRSIVAGTQTTAPLADERFDPCVVAAAELSDAPPPAASTHGRSLKATPTSG